MFKVFALSDFQVSPDAYFRAQASEEEQDSSRSVGEQLARQGIRFCSADILNAEQIRKAFSSADCVIHCAGKTGDWGSYMEFYETNVQGTKNIVAACKANQIKRIVFVSTPSIYFSGHDRLDIKESDSVPARQLPYGKTKLLAEELLFALRPAGINVISLRPRAVYGPYDNTIVPRILKMAEKKRFPLIEGGKALTDITYIENLTMAVKQCLSAPENSWNHAYSISNGSPVTVRDWFAMVLDVFEKPFRPRNIPLPLAKVVAWVSELTSRLPLTDSQPSMTRFSVGYMSKSITMSIDKAKTRLGYEPRFSNRQGFEQYALKQRG